MEWNGMKTSYICFQGCFAEFHYYFEWWMRRICGRHVLEEAVDLGFGLSLVILQIENGKVLHQKGFTVESSFIIIKY